MKHVESKLFNQNGHFYFSFQICITCTYLTNIFGYIYIYIYDSIVVRKLIRVLENKYRDKTVETLFDAKSRVVR